MVQFLRVVREGNAVGQEQNTTTYELTLFGALMTALAAIGSFGSFLVNLTHAFGLWK